MKLRVGIPITGGKLIAAAREAGYPVLFSANAFFVPHGKSSPLVGEFRKFKDIDHEQFAGVDAALDSAGFVAAAKYGDYRWTPEAYMDLAAAFPWAWYASMDFCVEEQVAGDKSMRLLRMAATAQMLGRLNRLADIRMMKRPMPVIQGWTADEYVQCASWLPLHEWPDLVGIGSVCRRHLHGDDGIYAILNKLDQVLPPHVKLHLFGVKSTALETLAGHPRIASSDSMAWDFDARCERRTGRDMEFRVERMHLWASKQTEIIATAKERAQTESGEVIDLRQTCLFPPDEFRIDTDEQAMALEALALTWAGLLLEDAIEYKDAVWGSVVDAYPLMARIHNDGIVSAARDTGEDFAGFLDNFIELADQRNPDLAARLREGAGEDGRDDVDRTEHIEDPSDSIDVVGLHERMAA